MPVAAPGSPRYINRELSRLDFDERVLAMAEDPKLPLFERVRFLAIFSQNLDDFFQVRVAGLKEQVLASVAVASPDGMSPLDQLKAIRSRVEDLTARQVGLYTEEILPALAEAGIALVRGDAVTKQELHQLHTVEQGLHVATVGQECRIDQRSGGRIGTRQPHRAPAMGAKDANMAGKPVCPDLCPAVIF